MSLKVVVVRCENLKNEDKIGKSDPYIELEVDGQKQKTSVKQDDLSPTWNEEFTFANIHHPDHKKLELTVYDQDDMRRDEKLGHCHFDLHDLHNGRETEVTKTVDHHGLTFKKATVTVKLTAIGWGK
eukprot:TRINITY_DN92919_c0_g1_i1.p2 TRINITY_DN92919_c0_g1~~TRINITY_DN92919_c0_g1_i1.p2  ORF type:complete len:135 (-),score=38.27 TRINITY_DN92919_c0_g1_i1:57-437(-)